MSLREIAVFVPLIAWSVWIGVYPKPYFDVLRQPVNEIVQRVRPGYFAGRIAGGPTQAGSPAPLGGAQ
jgi:NADH-quinone oxidoreductase subunit M